MMTDLRFDPSKTVTFDLAHGLVHLEGAPAQLLVPAEALRALAEAAGAEAAAVFGRTLGEAMGRRVSGRLSAAQGEGAGVGGAAIDVVVDHLGGEVALSGLGSLGLERWGRALVLVIDQSPLGAAGDALVEAALAGAVAAAAGRNVRTALLGREGVRARFFVGGEAGTAKVKAWLAEGLTWGDALVRLHAPVTIENEEGGA